MEIEVITKKIRKTIINFLNNYDNSDYEIILDMILTTDKLDDKLIQYDNFFNKNNINRYKNLLYKIILSDNYLYLKSTKKDILIQYEIENNSDYNEFDEENELMQYIDQEIINILEENDLYKMNDYEIRLILYSNFIIYNILLSEQKEDYENIKDDENGVKTLKKINPIYFLDF